MNTELPKAATEKLQQYVRGGRYVGDELYKDLVRRLPAPPLERSFEALFPAVAKEWDRALNAPLTPDLFTPGSGQKIWWRCADGHSWSAVISARCNGSGCPYCSKRKAVLSNESSLAALFPDIAREWDIDRNGGVRPDKVLAGTKKKAWWKCAKGHEWEVGVVVRTRNGNGCPYCSNRKISKGNSFASEFPLLLKEWNFSRNEKDPTNIAPRSDYKAWWKCGRCDHEWQAKVYSRAQGRGCIKCSYADGARHRKLERSG
jgi:glutaredoxin